MHQYFEDNRDLTTNRKEISFRFWCLNYTFVSDNGVFSKDKIDQGSIILLDTIIASNKALHKTLDLGCGYGVVGIILKKHFEDCEVEAVDVNPRALKLAKENAITNGVKIKVYESFAFEKIESKDFNTIITNPPIRAGKKVVYEMFEQACEHLKIDGCLWVVIRKQQGANSAIMKIKALFNNCEVVKKQSGYYILYAKKH